MPIKGEQKGYTYKALINGEWQEVTIQESPLELVERFEQDEEWTRVRHGYWKQSCSNGREICSVCGLEVLYGMSYDLAGNIYPKDYCPHCGAKMDEVREDA